MHDEAGSLHWAPGSEGETRRVGPQIECAHKKGAGSTKNGRDSNAQRLGVKVYGDQPVRAGGIIVRQRGTKASWGPGNAFNMRRFVRAEACDARRASPRRVFAGSEPLAGARWGAFPGETRALDVCPRCLMVHGSLNVLWPARASLLCAGGPGKRRSRVNAAPADAPWRQRGPGLGPHHLLAD